MRFSAGLFVAAAASVASAQYTYDNTTDTYSCPVANGTYCAGDSLSGSMIILCTNGVGFKGDCSGHAQHRPPIDVYEAPCWQISADAGNATCSKNCTVFPDMGVPYAVPGGCNTTGPDDGSQYAGWAFNGSVYNGPVPGNSSTSASATATATATGKQTGSATHSASPTSTSVQASTGGAAAVVAAPVFGTLLFGLFAFAL